MKNTVNPKVLPDGKMIILYIVTVITFCALNCMVLQARDFDGPYLYAENDIFKLIHEEVSEPILQVQSWMLDFHPRVEDNLIPQRILNEQERAGQPTASAGEYSTEPELKVKEWMVNIDSWDQTTFIAEP